MICDMPLNTHRVPCVKQRLGCECLQTVREDKEPTLWAQEDIHNPAEKAEIETEGWAQQGGGCSVSRVAWESGTGWERMG